MTAMRRQAGLVLLAYFLLALPFWLAAAFLWRSSELWRADWVVSAQIASEAVWSGRIGPEERAYKRALYRQVRPSAVLIGSSRVLQIRRDFFTVSFANMGRGFDTTALAASMNELSAQHHPDLVLIGLDYWLFSEERRLELSEAQARENLLAANKADSFINIVPRVVLTPWEWLLQRRMTPRESFQFLLTGNGRPGARLGMIALFTDTGGYAPDGSYYYFETQRRPEALRCNLEREVSEHVRARGVYQLPEPSKISSAALADLREAVRQLKSQRTDVVLFLPPLHPLMQRALLERPGYAPFARELAASIERIARESHVGFYDFLTTDFAPHAGEFHDAFHPGEVLSARMLLHMAKDDSAMSTRLDTQAVERFIQAHTGETTPASPYLASYRIPREAFSGCLP